MKKFLVIILICLLKFHIFSKKCYILSEIVTNVIIDYSTNDSELKNNNHTIFNSDSLSIFNNNNDTKIISENLINISETQSYLYNRIKSSKYVNNPYMHLNSNQSKTSEFQNHFNKKAPYLIY